MASEETPDLTWGEFKAAVEAQGVTDDCTISWIDINGMYNPTVEKYPSGAFKIADGGQRNDDDEEPDAGDHGTEPGGQG